MSMFSDTTPRAGDDVRITLQKILQQTISNGSGASATSVAAAIAAMTVAQINATLAELGLVDSSSVVKWWYSLGDGTGGLGTNNDVLAQIVLGMDTATKVAWQEALFGAFFIDVTDATYTIQATDVGKIIRFNRPTDITVTCPKAFVAGFNCCWLQKGNGQVNFTAQAGGSAAVVNVDSHYWSKGPYAVGSLIVESNSDNNSAIWYLAGATAIST